MKDQMTDATIIVVCGECNAEATGVDAMMSHILDFHTNYTPVEARNFAEQWTEDAHDAYHDFIQDYAHDQDRLNDRTEDRKNVA
jgi:hypothetical protein